jgi:hypothetical protein
LNAIKFLSTYGGIYMRILVFIFSILIQAANPLFAEEYTAEEFTSNTWLEVATASSGTIWKMRAKDMLNNADFNPMVWVSMDHSKDKKITYRGSKRLIKFDCKNKKSATIQVTQYWANGSVKDTWEDKYPSFDYVTPDSVIEAALEAACPKQN